MLPQMRHPEPMPPRRSSATRGRAVAEACILYVAILTGALLATRCDASPCDALFSLSFVTSNRRLTPYLKLQITSDMLEQELDIVSCSGCSLCIRVLFEMADSDGAPGNDDR